MPKVTEEHRQARRGQILDAARRCFLREGFHSTSMSDLRAESGLSAGALYTYFAGKEDVILAIVDQNVRDVISTLRETQADGGDPRTVSELFTRVAAMITARQRTDGFASLVLLVWSESTRDERLRERVATLLVQYTEQFAQIAADQGLAAAAASPRSVGTLMTSLVAGFIVGVAIEGEPAVLDLPVTIDALLRQLPTRGKSPG